MPLRKKNPNNKKKNNNLKTKALALSLIGTISLNPVAYAKTISPKPAITQNIQKTALKRSNLKLKRIMEYKKIKESYKIHFNLLKKLTNNLLEENIKTSIRLIQIFNKYNINIKEVDYFFDLILRNKQKFKSKELFNGKVYDFLEHTLYIIRNYGFDKSMFEDIIYILKNYKDPLEICYLFEDLIKLPEKERKKLIRQNKEYMFLELAIDLKDKPKIYKAVYNFIKEEKINNYEYTKLERYFYMPEELFLANFYFIKAFIKYDPYALNFIGRNIIENAYLYNKKERTIIEKTLKNNTYIILEVLSLLENKRIKLDLDLLDILLDVKHINGNFNRIITILYDIAPFRNYSDNERFVLVKTLVNYAKTDKDIYDYLEYFEKEDLKGKNLEEMLIEFEQKQRH